MGFAAEWLALREPADLRARDAGLLRRALDHAGTGATLLDLGSGTGSTARAYAAAGATDLTWRFLDNDPNLLARAADHHPQAEIHHADLARTDALPLAGVAMVTASALLDLMPRDWLVRLADRLAQGRIGLHATLSYDGVMHWQPEDPQDRPVTERFNAHQRGDKGLGPALGPDAAAQAAQVLRARGHSVALAPSPWRLGPGDAALHRELLDGIGKAAAETGLAQAAAWAARRRAQATRCRAVIGHLDLLALPPPCA